MSQCNTAVQLKISQSLLCKSLINRGFNKKKKSRMKAQNARGTEEEKVVKVLKLCFSNVRENDAPVSGPLIRQKTVDLEE